MSEKKISKIPGCIGCGGTVHGPDHGPVNAYIACLVEALKKERERVKELEDTIRGAHAALHAP